MHQSVCENCSFRLAMDYRFPSLLPDTQGNLPQNRMATRGSIGGIGARSLTSARVKEWQSPDLRRAGPHLCASSTA